MLYYLCEQMLRIMTHFLVPLQGRLTRFALREMALQYFPKPVSPYPASELADVQALACLQDVRLPDLTPILLMFLMLQPFYERTESLVHSG